LSLSVPKSRNVYLKSFGNISKASIVGLKYLREIAEEHNIGLVELGFPYPHGRVSDLSSSNEVREAINDIVSSFRTTCHAPMVDLTSLNEKKRKENVKEMIDSVQFALDFEVNHFVMHLAASGKFSFIPWPRRKVSTELIQKAGERSFREIMKYFGEKEEKLVVGLENLTGHEPGFQDPQDFKHLFGKDIGLTLDVVHALSWNLNSVKMIDSYQKHLIEVHLTDGTGQGRVVKHYALGEGRAPLDSLLHKLREIEFGGPVIVEVDNPEDFEKSWQWLQNR
jgi:sugar phosphate isomerase/epimerase